LLLVVGAKGHAKNRGVRAFILNNKKMR